MSDRVSHGVNPHLEGVADSLIRESLKGVTKHSEKSDILTPWKMQDRKNREVYVAGGTPDSANRLGMFHRTYNAARPDLNSCDGIAACTRRGATPRLGNGVTGGSLGYFVEQHTTSLTLGLDEVD